MPVRFLLAIAVVASVWPFVGGGDAHACTRSVFLSQEQLIQRDAEASDLIFLGTVLKDEEPDRDHLVRAFAVERYLKGQGPRQLTIVQRAACPGSMEVGARYLVSWTGGANNINLDRLSSAEAEQHIAQMETAVLAEYGTLGSFTDDPLPPWATAAGFGVAGLLGAGLLLGVRRLRSS